MNANNRAHIRKKLAEGKITPEEAMDILELTHVLDELLILTSDEY